MFSASLSYYHQAKQPQDYYNRNRSQHRAEAVNSSITPPGGRSVYLLINYLPCWPGWAPGTWTWCAAAPWRACSASQVRRPSRHPRRPWTRRRWWAGSETPPPAWPATWSHPNARVTYPPLPRNRLTPTQKSTDREGLRDRDGLRGWWRQRAGRPATRRTRRRWGGGP